VEKFRSLPNDADLPRWGISHFMKTSAAITLIVCGTVLILVPHILNAIGTAQVAHLIEATQKPDVSLNGGLDPAYTTWTIVVGILMIISGVAGALKTKS